MASQRILSSHSEDAACRRLHNGALAEPGSVSRSVSDFTIRFVAWVVVRSPEKVTQANGVEVAKSDLAQLVDVLKGADAGSQYLWPSA